MEEFIKTFIPIILWITKDVDRLASHLNDKNIYKMYIQFYILCLGHLPFITEVNVELKEKRTRDDDSPLRPCLELTEMQGKNPALVSHLFRLSQIHQYFLPFNTVNLKTCKSK